jgi:hypothetical protein
VKPDWFPALPIAVASNALAGRLDRAHKASTRLSALDPAFRISNTESYFPFARPEDLVRLQQALRVTGLPE